MPLSPALRFREAFKLISKQETLLGALVVLVACCEAVVTLSRGGTEEDRQLLRIDLVTEWHNIVTPLDIPGVPNSIEPMVDGFIEQAVLAGTTIGFDRLAELRAQVEEKLKAA